MLCSYSERNSLGSFWISHKYAEFFSLFTVEMMQLKVVAQMFLGKLLKYFGELFRAVCPSERVMLWQEGSRIAVV